MIDFLFALMLIMCLCAFIAMAYILDFPFEDDKAEKDALEKRVMELK